MPQRVANEPYLRSFRYKVLNSILFTNELLCKIVFSIFLTKASEQHKGRLLVVVSFFVYFRRVSSLSETSSGNDYN